jgi:hypothetical protein
MPRIATPRASEAIVKNVSHDLTMPTPDRAANPTGSEGERGLKNRKRLSNWIGPTRRKQANPPSRAIANQPRRKARGKTEAQGPTKVKRIGRAADDGAVDGAAETDGLAKGRKASAPNAPGGTKVLARRQPKSSPLTSRTKRMTWRIKKPGLRTTATFLLGRRPSV